jgi:polyisoprenoid-binding protein YceI
MRFHPLHLSPRTSLFRSVCRAISKTISSPVLSFSVSPFPVTLPKLPSRILLVWLLIACLALAACGGNDDEPVVENTPVPAATEAPPATEPPPAQAPAAEAEATEVEAVDAEAEPTPTAAEAEAAQQASVPRVFVIDPAQTEARFIVDEVLFGSPNTVTGKTNEVSGEIEIILDTPPQATVREIQINARSLATDNRFRNRSLNRLILQSNRDEYQFIIFTPTAIEGLPAEANVGDTFTFEITGDLKIREIVQPTTFEVTVTADSDTQISGLAQAMVLRSDFDLSIPNVEGVADVTEEVRLELQFVATAGE